MLQVGPLQREHTLRLLSAPAFTRQLAGLKLLNELVRAAPAVPAACAVHVTRSACVLRRLCFTSHAVGLPRSLLLITPSAPC